MNMPGPDQREFHALKTGDGRTYFIIRSFHDGHCCQGVGFSVTSAYTNWEDSYRSYIRSQPCHV